MKKILLFVCKALAAVGLAAQEPDSLAIAAADSLYLELTSATVTAERPVVKVDKGALVYDLPRILEKTPADNALEAIGKSTGEEWLPAGGDESGGHCQGREGDGCEGVRTPSLSLFRYQFVACSPDIQNLDAGVAGEAVAEAGDEDLEAAGVEEVVIAPEGQEDVLGGDDAAAAFA